MIDNKQPTFELIEAPVLSAGARRLASTALTGSLWDLDMVQDLLELCGCGFISYSQAKDELELWRHEVTWFASDEFINTLMSRLYMAVPDLTFGFEGPAFERLDCGISHE